MTSRSLSRRYKNTHGFCSFNPPLFSRGLFLSPFLSLILSDCPPSCWFPSHRQNVVQNQELTASEQSSNSSYCPTFCCAAHTSLSFSAFNSSVSLVSKVRQKEPVCQLDRVSLCQPAGVLLGGRQCFTRVLEMMKCRISETEEISWKSNCYLNKGKLAENWRPRKTIEDLARTICKVFRIVLMNEISQGHLDRVVVVGLRYDLASVPRLCNTFSSQLALRVQSRYSFAIAGRCTKPSP